MPSRPQIHVLLSPGSFRRLITALLGILPSPMMCPL
jgi:hypothetical protein